MERALSRVDNVLFQHNAPPEISSLLKLKAFTDQTFRAHIKFNNFQFHSANPSSNIRIVSYGHNLPRSLHCEWLTRCNFILRESVANRIGADGIRLQHSVRRINNQSLILIHENVADCYHNNDNNNKATCDAYRIYFILLQQCPSTKYVQSNNIFSVHGITMACDVHALPSTHSEFMFGFCLGYFMETCAPGVGVRVLALHTCTWIIPAWQLWSAYFIRIMTEHAHVVHFLFKKSSQIIFRIDALHTLYWIYRDAHSTVRSFASIHRARRKRGEKKTTPESQRSTITHNLYFV